VKRAASAAAKHAADKAGLGDAAEKLKESGAEVWKKAEQLGKAVKDRVPEDLGERAQTTIGEAGKGIARGARALSEKLRAALQEEERTDDERQPGEPPRAEATGSEAAASDEREEKGANGDRVGAAFKGFARWMEGPGAPRDDDDTSSRSSRVRRQASDGEVVEAKDTSEPSADVVTP